jgi:peptide/nickel transport system permease protein
MSQEALHGEAYLDIVWRQFQKNRFALAALLFLAPVFLAAIFAPLIASSEPLVCHELDAESGNWTTIYPWLTALFNPAETVDFVFNMALVGFVPWVILGLSADWLWRRLGMAGRWRAPAAAALYVVLIAALSLAFSLSWFRPTNPYAGRSFAEEQYKVPDRVRGWYAPIPFGPTEQDIESRFKPPLFVKAEKQCKTVTQGFIHVLGTDNDGRDVLARMLYGSRISLTIGFVAVAIYLVIGVVLGALAGYFGGALDILISRVIEIVMVFPSFFLILTLVALLGQSIYIIMIVIGLTGWTSVARLTRGEVLKQRAIDYVAAARAVGSSHLRIIFRHILANALSPALVVIPFGIADAIVTEAGLSLLGFGVRDPAPSWGTLLHLVNGNYNYWWLLVFPSLAIFATVTLFNLVGGGLRDAMDPKLRM